MSNFHERIKELRESSGKTQVQIAEELKITPQALSYYFNGREPNFELLIKMAKYFDVSVDYLIGKSHHKNIEKSISIASNIEEPSILKNESELNDFKTLISTILEICSNLSRRNVPEGIIFIDYICKEINKFSDSAYDFHNNMDFIFKNADIKNDIIDPIALKKMWQKRSEYDFLINLTLQHIKTMLENLNMEYHNRLYDGR